MPAAEVSHTPLPRRKHSEYQPTHDMQSVSTVCLQVLATPFFQCLKFDSEAFARTLLAIWCFVLSVKVLLLQSFPAEIPLLIHKTG